ncbi:MAG: hemolysin family protein [Prevotella stercorea]|uniref:hemolysin family protein n=1 Tax=Leyella stercorea TaxID=363265 RepID=UPI0025CC18B7|nr:hemolysin family protein [Prevotella sp.]MDD6939332.1 hemolysin family protein [Leyella stercorea]MCI6106898.1 hemolysin family protein [Prevotella sp.]MCI6130916.1 hemolysin family protein [Prevotella sp.]MCI6489498.1 hemolysin family protein [Prevotella sp.]
MALSAFFSGMEIAFVSSNRMLAEMDREGNGIAKKIISKFYNHPNGFVSTMLVGNNIVLVVYGILVARLFDSTIFSSLDDGMKVTADTLLSTLVILFTGEFLPKILFKNNANRLLSVFSVPAYLFYILLWPISRFSTLMSKCLLRIVGIRMEAEADDEGFSKVDLDYLVQSSIENAHSDEEINEEVKIFQNALDFSDCKVRDCMVPRTEVNAVDVNDCTVDELMQKFVESGNSKIIVYEGDIDHIIGYIHSSEMFRNRDNWRQCVCKMPFVPETMAAQKLMHIFLQQKKSLGVVIDEFGGTSGIVSLEDIVEEIFGDIEDEHDSTKYIATQVGDNEYMLSARLEIDKVNELFDLGLPESDDYMTVGGYILHEYQSFPKLNEVITIGRYEFRIIKSTMTKIELVKLKVNR